MVPAVGERAPNFKLPRDGGGTVSLADFKGRKLVLYFYPKADTPGCTKEAIDFNALRRAFAKAETDIVGVRLIRWWPRRSSAISTIWRSRSLPTKRRKC